MPKQLAIPAHSPTRHSPPTLPPVPVSRTVQQSAVLVFLAVTLSGIWFTFTRIPVPLVPWELQYYSYGMMAPYQGDTPWNGDFLYEGMLPDGTWETITTDRYLPYGFGERNVRKVLRKYVGSGPGVRQRKFTDFALQLLDRERERGKPYRSVRITYEQWPRSNAGYAFLRHEPFFLERQLVTQVQ